MLYSWVEPLIVAKESFELIFRHGQKTDRCSLLADFPYEIEIYLKI